MATATKVADLRGLRPEATLEGPKSSKGGKVGRDRAKPDTSTYEGRFAARLGDLAKAAGFEPPALAERLGVSEQVVYDWLAGRKMPAVGRFPVLAKLFKLKHPGDILPPK
jgi:ribosome-binding protein aMBF1 (putative translation factor)